MDKRETSSDYEIEKKIIGKYSLFQNVLRQLLFLEIVFVMKIKNKLFIMYKGVVG